MQYRATRTHATGAHDEDSDAPSCTIPGSPARRTQNPSSRWWCNGTLCDCARFVKTNRAQSQIEASPESQNPSSEPFPDFANCDCARRLIEDSCTTAKPAHAIAPVTHKQTQPEAISPELDGTGWAPLMPRPLSAFGGTNSLICYTGAYERHARKRRGAVLSQA